MILTFCVSGYLNPVDAAGVDPDEVARTLKESVHWYFCLHQVLHVWPPLPLQVVHSVFLAQVVQGAPVVLRHAKPLTVSWADVEVDRAEVVLLLVGHRPGAGNLHRHPDRVHPDQLVAQVGEHVAGRHDSRPMWELHQLL